MADNAIDVYKMRLISNLALVIILLSILSLLMPSAYAYDKKFKSVYEEVSDCMTGCHPPTVDEDGNTIGEREYNSCWDTCNELYDFTKHPESLLYTKTTPESNPAKGFFANLKEKIGGFMEGIATKTTEAFSKTFGDVRKFFSGG